MQVMCLAQSQIPEPGCTDEQLRRQKGCTTLHKNLTVLTFPPDTLHPTPYPLPPSPYTRHPTPDTLHPAPNTHNQNPKTGEVHGGCGGPATGRTPLHILIYMNAESLIVSQGGAPNDLLTCSDGTLQQPDDERRVIAARRVCG